MNPDAADTDGEYDHAAQHAEEQEQQDPLGRPNLELNPMLLQFFYAHPSYIEIDTGHWDWGVNLYLYIFYTVISL